MNQQPGNNESEAREEARNLIVLHGPAMAALIAIRQRNEAIAQRDDAYRAGQEAMEQLRENVIGLLIRIHEDVTVDGVIRTVVAALDEDISEMFDCALPPAQTEGEIRWLDPNNLPPGE